MIVQAGPYPEPIGGISVYIKRMKQRMDSLGIENEVWDLSGVKKKEKGVLQLRLRYLPFKLLFRKDIDIIHYNMAGIRPKIYIGIFNRIFFKKRKKVITIHGDCENSLRRYGKKLVRALNSFDCIICVKAGDAQKLVEAGVTKPSYDIPALLFPVKNEETEIPGRIIDFINQKKFVICANASSIQFYNNEDLYGIDMCIELISSLKKDGIDAGLIFCLPLVDKKDYYKELIRRIDLNGIQKDFLFVHEKMELWPVIAKSNLFIRPTSTDGYSISVAEAIYFGVPTLASDVTNRPEGTLLFESRNFEQLYRKTVEVINDYESIKNKVNKVELKDSFERLMSIYKEMGVRDI